MPRVRVIRTGVQLPSPPLPSKEGGGEVWEGKSGDRSSKVRLVLTMFVDIAHPRATSGGRKHSLPSRPPKSGSSTCCADKTTPHRPPLRSIYEGEGIHGFDQVLAGGEHVSSTEGGASIQGIDQRRQGEENQEPVIRLGMKMSKVLAMLEVMPKPTITAATRLSVCGTILRRCRWPRRELLRHQRAQ